MIKIFKSFDEEFELDEELDKYNNNNFNDIHPINKLNVNGGTNRIRLNGYFIFDY